MKRIITIVIIIIFIISLIFIKFVYKKINFGNTINSKTAHEIANNILDMNSYEAKAEITIKTNKNINKYVVIEKYNKSENSFCKEVIEPENINGIKFIYNGTDLKIENSRINATKIYKEYKYIGEENISLIGFVDSYIEAEETKIEETNDEVIITVKTKNENKYIAYKKLYISKKTKNPLKMEIKNTSQKDVIYILYNEIKINNLR